MPALSVTDLRVRQAILETLAAGGTPARIGVMQSLEPAYADVAAALDADVSFVSPCPFLGCADLG